MSESHSSFPSFPSLTRALALSFFTFLFTGAVNAQSQPTPAAGDSWPAVLERGRTHEQAGRVKEAATAYREVLFGSKVPPESDSRARVALVRLWVAQQQKQKTPVCMPKVVNAKEGMLLPRALEARDQSRKHLLCVQKRGGQESEVTRLVAQLDALDELDRTGCAASARKPFAKDRSAGMLGVLTTKGPPEPCQPPSLFTGDAVVSELGAEPRNQKESLTGLEGLGISSMEAEPTTTKKTKKTPKR